MRSLARRILSAWGLRNAELSIVLAGGKAVQDLNRRYRGKNKPTDVLSFPLEENLAGKLAKDPQAGFARHKRQAAKEILRRSKLEGGAPLPLGDVVLCIPVVKQQMKEYGENERQAYARLLAHGIAHLLGYDHEKGPAWERAMKKVEEGARR